MVRWLTLGLLVVVLFSLFHGPVVTDKVELNTFAPVARIHLADWVMAGFLLFFVGTNIYRMYSSVMRKAADVKIPFSIYILGGMEFGISLS